MKIRVYYEDTDCGNVVYYANYLRYFERSRTEFLRDRGLDLADFHKKGLVFAVTEASLKYRKSAFYNDLLDVETTIKEVTSVRMTFETKVFNQHGDLLTIGDAKLVGISTATGRACRLPEEMIAALSKVVSA